MNCPECGYHSSNGHDPRICKLNGVQLIAAERTRQIEDEGYRPQHDDQHQNGEIIEAALCYGHVASAEVRGSFANEWTYGMVASGEMFCQWPWGKKWWKPSDDPIRNLVKAGALIAAEIDRLQRIANKEVQS